MGDSRTCWFAAGYDPAEIMQIVAQVRGTIAGMQALWRPGGQDPKCRRRGYLLFTGGKAKDVDKKVSASWLTWCGEV